MRGCECPMDFQQLLMHIGVLFLKTIWKKKLPQHFRNTEQKSWNWVRREKLFETWF